MVLPRRPSEVCDIEEVIKVNVTILMMVIKVRIGIKNKTKMKVVVMLNHYCLVSSNQQETNFELEAPW